MKEAPNLPRLGEHGLVVDAGHRLHLVDDDERPTPPIPRQAALLADDAVHEIEDGGPEQGGNVVADDALCGGDEEDAAVEDGPPQVDGGSGLAEERACAFG